MPRNEDEDFSRYPVIVGRRSRGSRIAAVRGIQVATIMKQHSDTFPDLWHEHHGGDTRNQCVASTSQVVCAAPFFRIRPVQNRYKTTSMRHPLQAVALLTLGLFPLFELHSQIFSDNLLLNPGAESGLTGWTSGGNSTPRVDSGTFNPGIKPHSGGFAFLGGVGSVGSLSQTVSLSGIPGFSTDAIDSGSLFASISFWAQGLNQGTPSDSPKVSLDFRDGASLSLQSVTTPEVDSHGGQWLNHAEQFSVPAGTRSITYTMDFIRHVGSDLDAYVDDNSLALVAVPEPAETAAAVGVGLVAVAAVRRSRRTGVRAGA